MPSLSEQSLNHLPLFLILDVDRRVAINTGVDHWGGDEGDASPLRPKQGDGLYNHPPPHYKGDKQMKSILHNTQIITPEEIVSYIDYEIIFSRKF